MFENTTNRRAPNGAPSISLDSNAWDDAMRRVTLARTAGNYDARAYDELMTMPAPTPAALLWKIDQLFGESTNDGFSDSWASEWIAPMVADARRFLASA